MNRRSVSIATRGRISANLKAVTIASIGWIVFSVTPVVNNGGGGGGSLMVSYQNVHGTEILEKIVKDDDEILTILKTYFEWQT